MPRNKLAELAGMSDDELERQVMASAEVDAGLNKFMVDEVVPYGRSVTPVLGEDSKKGRRDARRVAGAAAASWKVVKKARNGRGVVAMTIWYAHFLEFGTGDPGPTKAYAPVQKTASHFGGSLKRTSAKGERLVMRGGIALGGDES